ncbi:MAG: bactofilin family protein [Anaerolineae bacterium]
MTQRWNLAVLIALLMALFAWPVLAQSGGGIHFGPYTLGADERTSGDLVVFGPVRLEEDSVFEGDLSAFGAVDMKDDAVITGDLVAFGAAEVAGTVEGDLFCAGMVSLLETAVIEGDVSSMGGISREEGATIRGDVVPVDEDFEWDMPGFGPMPGVSPRFVRPGWMGFLWDLVRGVVTIFVIGIFALLIASIWPQQMERVGQTLVESPLPSFGVGVLALLAAAALIAILLATICLSPLALLGAVVVGLGVVFGWVALGAVLGERMLRGIFHSQNVTPVGSTLLGTALVTLLAVLVNAVSDCLYPILIFQLFALAAGAVTLTRFGTMPYAATGGAGTGTVRPPAGSPHTPPSAERPPRIPAELEERRVPEEGTSEPSPVVPSPVTEEEELPSPYYGTEAEDEESEGDEA